MKTSVIWASLSAAGNCHESSILLKNFLHITDAKISEYGLIIFVGISVSWDDLVVSRLPIFLKTSSLVTWENVNVEWFNIYLVLSKL